MLKPAPKNPASIALTKPPAHYLLGDPAEIEAAKAKDVTHG